VWTISTGETYDVKTVSLIQRMRLARRSAGLSRLASWRTLRGARAPEIHSVAGTTETTA